jgi:UDP-2-acetamido-3-amino-2,3-dideoxy-glucuronate N-acetyltransferase
MSDTTHFFAHPTAVVDENCRIGQDTRIWHFCHLMPDCQIGKNCVLGQNVFVASGVVVGDHCKVQNNVSLYKGVTCRDGVFIGPSVVFTNVMNPRARIERKEEFRPTLVKEGATIGANSTVLCGISIGAYSFIGAGSVVTRDVPDYALVYGNPAKAHGWMSRRGLRLDFDSSGAATCPESGEQYRLEGNRVVNIED